MRNVIVVIGNGKVSAFSSIKKMAEAMEWNVGTLYQYLNNKGNGVEYQGCRIYKLKVN